MLLSVDGAERADHGGDGRHQRTSLPGDDEAVERPPAGEQQQPRPGGGVQHAVGPLPGRNRLERPAQQHERRREGVEMEQPGVPDAEVVQHRERENGREEDRGKHELVDRAVAGDEEKAGQRVQDARQHDAGDQRAGREAAAVRRPDDDHLLDHRERGQRQRLRGQVLPVGQRRHDLGLQRPLALLQQHEAGHEVEVDHHEVAEHDGRQHVAPVDRGEAGEHDEPAGQHEGHRVVEAVPHLQAEVQADGGGQPVHRLTAGCGR